MHKQEIITAEAGSTVYAKDGSLVTAEAGSIVFAKAGSLVYNVTQRCTKGMEFSTGL